MSQFHQPPPHPATSYYPGYATAQPKDLTVLGVLAFATAALYTVLALVTATVSGRAVRHLDTAETDYDWSLAVYAAGVFLGLLVLAGGYVTGAMWLYRARKNAELMEPGRHHARRAGWAWGGWVCPVVSLWFPFQLVRDTHKAVSPLSVSPLVGWWWAFFLVENIALRIARSLESRATAEDASNAQGFEVFASMAMVVALVLWGLVLRRVTKEQHARMYAAR
jgi:hypothetical protein